MRKDIKIWLVVFSLGIMRPSIQAQNQSEGECNNALVEANRLYKSGKIEASVGILETCGTSLKTKQERIEKHRLLALCSQAVDDLTGLENSSVELLRLNPQYQVYSLSHDPSIFNKYINGFKVVPSHYVGIFFGLSSLQPRVTVNNNVHPASEVTYKNSAGYQLGVEWQARLNTRLFMNTQLSVEGGAIQKEVRNITDFDLDYLERFDYAFIRLQPGYRLGKTGLSVMAGVETAASLRNQGVVTTTLFENGWVRQYSRNNSEERNRFFVGGALALSYEAHIGPGLGRVSLQQSLPLNALVKSGAEANNLSFALDAQHMSDELKLSRTSVQLSFALPVQYSVTR